MTSPSKPRTPNEVKNSTGYLELKTQVTDDTKQHAKPNREQRRMKSQDLSQHPSYDPLINSSDAADYLSIHKESLLKMARRGEIASVKDRKKPKGSVFFRLSVLNQWIKAQERPARRSAA